MLKTLVCAAALIATVSPAAASEGPAPDPIEVQTADLDLTSPEGRAQLDRRIREAARTACGRPNSASNLEVANNRRCRNLSTIAARQEAAVVVARRTSDAALAVR